VEKQIEGLELIFIELPKFHPSNRAEKKLYDLWLTFLTKIKDGDAEVPSELLSANETKEAVQYLERSAYSDVELEAYDRYGDSISVVRTVYVDAKAEGEAIGLEKGEAIGIEKSLRNIVLNAACAGHSIAEIQTITDLPAAKIEEILN
jgi:hypothetical protein